MMQASTLIRAPLLVELLTEELPPRALLEKKLHESIRLARERFNRELN